MSVKRKIKRLNKQIKELQEELQIYKLSRCTLKSNLDHLKLELAKQETDKQYTKQLENIVKYALTNHIGNLRGGIRIERYETDKLQNLKLNVIFEPESNSYIIRANY